MGDHLRILLGVVVHPFLLVDHFFVPFEEHQIAGGVMHHFGDYRVCMCVCVFVWASVGQYDRLAEIKINNFDDVVCSIIAF